VILNLIVLKKTHSPIT